MTFTLGVATVVGQRSARPRRPLVVRAGTNTRVVVCTNKDCSRRGGKRTLGFCRDLAPQGVDIEEQDCLDECGMGPNVQVQPDGKILNGLKTRDAVAAMFAAQCVNGVEAEANLEQMLSAGPDAA
eukprot:jgi/Tetstr1/431796/TSEL_021291.t1